MLNREKLHTGRNAFRPVWLIFVGGVTAFLCSPFAISIPWLGDEGVLLHGAERLLSGEKLYLDFFAILPPGGYALTAAWLAVVGDTILSVRVLAISTIVGIACFTFLTCRQTSGNNGFSALLVIGWVIASQGGWTVISHHWMSLCFSVMAAWASSASLNGASNHRVLWAVLAGLGAGTALTITTSRGVVVIVAVGILILTGIRRFPTAPSYVLASLAVPACAIVYVWRQSSLGAAYQNVIEFPLMQYSSIQWVPFANGWAFHSSALAFVFPFTVLMAVLAFKKTADEISCLKMRQGVVFACAGLATSFPRPDMAHLGFAVPLVLPLLSTSITILFGTMRRIHRALVGAAISSLLAPSAAALREISSYVMNRPKVFVPRGAARFNDRTDGELVAWVSAREKTEKFFFYPYMPMVPFITRRLHVSKYDLFVPYYTTSDQYRDACISVMRLAEWIVVDAVGAQMANFRRVTSPHRVVRV